MNDSWEDHELFQLLDDYVRRLYDGKEPDRATLLRDHPELASALDCLEVLQGFSSTVQPELRDNETLEYQLFPDGLPRDFGPYELLSEIGRGGMGVVYKARQTDLDRTVAIKMILASHLTSLEHLRRFQLEAKAAARLQHPHIVHIHEVGQLHGQHYFAMEYVDGINLAQLITQGPVDLEEAVWLLGKVARAVAHLHQHGIVHRDLKPSNILLDAQGEPYVTDFGLAKVFAADSDLTATGVIAGTPSYMSPEQAAGRSAEVGPASDTYGLGAILYELLTGQPPFYEDHPLDTVLQVLSRQPILPRRLNRRIPRRLELICLKCLAKSPHERYASADALADDLERFARGEEPDVRPPHLGQQIWSWTRRQPALAARLGALGLFWGVELTNYGLGYVDTAFHVKTSILVFVWAVTSIVFQQFLDSRRWSIPARFIWGTLDLALLTAVLLVADGAASPLIVGYPLLLVGSGLWFRVRFVWFMAGLSLASYGILMLDFYRWRPELKIGFDSHADRHCIFALMLLLLAAVVAHLVQRVRTLSSYFGQKL